MLGLVAETPAARDRLLKLFREELFEDAYHPAILRERKIAERKKVAEKARNVALLDKVAKMGVSDKDVPKTVRPKARKPQRK